MKNLIDKSELISKLQTLEGLSDDERSSLIGLLRQHKKYGLVWEDKQEDVEERLCEELPILREVKEKAILSDDADAPNHILIEGDNLEALTALSYTHAGKIDIIYIDPPYNTGNKDFIYNDSFVDTEDSYRHSKWLSFMNKRLKIAKILLSSEGVIFISIDDNEQAQLRLLCDEIFGSYNFQGHIHWRRRHNQPNDKNKLIALVAEHVVVYSKNALQLKEFGVGKVAITGNFTNPDNDPKGPWTTNPWKAANGRGGTHYSITTPTGVVLTETWYGTKETFEEYLKKGRVHWTNGGNGIPRIKIYQKEAEESGQCANNWWPNDTFGCNQDATNELKDIFEGICPFDNPKPTKLLSVILRLGSIKKRSTILDFFAGSGTTLHATLQLNAEDGGHRQCILVTNNENNICEEVTYERNKRVINGYTTPKGIEVAGLKANTLHYYKTDYISRDRTQRNMRNIVAAATDLLCIKEDLYDEHKKFGRFKLKPQLARYFNNGKKHMLIVYREELIDEIAEEIKNIDFGKIRLKIYVFSPGRYAFTDNFREVEDKVELVALPAAIYDAYQKVLPKRKEKLFETEEKKETAPVSQDLFANEMEGGEA